LEWYDPFHNQVEVQVMKQTSLYEVNMTCIGATSFLGKDFKQDLPTLMESLFLLA
jgi:hypothetical protein